MEPREVAVDVEALYAGRSSPLLDRFPGLRGKLPWMPLGTLPTPVEPWPWPTASPEGRHLFVKRDDLTSPLYGGNKTRKLEHLLARAKLEGRRSLVTLGGLGSNQGLATALFGARLGLAVDLCLFDQPVTDSVRDTLLAAAATGANLLYGGGYPRTALLALAAYLRRWRSGQAPSYLAPGASSALGNVAYVNAALELAEQIRAGVLPEPDRVFVAAGSGGTAAGLIAGLALAGLRSRVVAVRTTVPLVANAARLLRLARGTLAALRRLEPAIPDLRRSRADFELETRFYGGAFGRETPEAAEALAWARARLALDATHTGKALAACLEACRRSRPGEVLLFWNTFSSAPLEKASPEALPPALRHLFPA